MKVAITGHTRGIGRALYDIFLKNGHDVIGFSRTTGYDISLRLDRTKILDQIQNADIFINNAYSPGGQTSLLEETISIWEGLDKKIINISSKLGFYPQSKISDLNQYILDKKTQNDIVVQRITKAAPQITNVVIGLVDTAMSKIFDSEKLNPNDLAEYIYNIVVNDKFYIQQIILDVPGLDWENIIGPWNQNK